MGQTWSNLGTDGHILDKYSNILDIYSNIEDKHCQIWDILITKKYIFRTDVIIFGTNTDKLERNDIIILGTIKLVKLRS